MANKRSFCFIFCYIEKPAYLSMPKLLAGFHYNGEEISRHLKKNIGYWPVQMNDKFATSQILKKTGRSCEGADLSWLSSKVSRTLQHQSNLVMFYIKDCMYIDPVSAERTLILLLMSALLGYCYISGMLVSGFVSILEVG
jgi:hypothetical protein